MRKVILFTAALAVAGVLAYYGGYYLYVTNRPKTVLEEPEMIPNGLLISGSSLQSTEARYYIAKIENGMLNIYDMPEKILYDSISLQHLQLQVKDYRELETGKKFAGLLEVFEFLESCMS